MSRSAATEALEHSVYLRSQGESARALEHIHEAERLAPESEVELRVRIATERAILEMLTGSPQRALTSLNWVLAEANSDRIDSILADAPGLDWHVARSFVIFLDAGLRLDHVHASKLLDAVDRGHEFLKRIGRPEWRDGLLDMHAGILRDMGELEDAVPLLREAADLARITGRGGPGLTLASYQRGLAEILRELDRLEEAREVLREILGDKNSSNLDRMGAHVMLGHIWAKEKEYERTILHGARAWDLAAGMFEKQRAIVKGLLFEGYKGQGDWQKAAQTASEELALARRAGVASIVCGALQDTIDVLLAQGRVDLVEEPLQEAEALAKRLDARTNRSVYADRIAERREQFDARRDDT